MNDKEFELLTKFYNDFSEFKIDITKKVEENSRHILRLEKVIKGGRGL